MERDRTTNREHAIARRGVDWAYVLAHMLMFPPLLMVGICSQLTSSARGGDDHRASSIFRVAAEDARNAISIAMTDI